MERSEILMIVLIGVLVITVGLQTVQLVKIGNGNTMAMPSMGMSSASPSLKASGPSAPTSLADLPSMVGGC